MINPHGEEYQGDEGLTGSEKLQLIQARLGSKKAKVRGCLRCGYAGHLTYQCRNVPLDSGDNGKNSNNSNDAQSVTKSKVKSEGSGNKRRASNKEKGNEKKISILQM